MTVVLLHGGGETAQAWDEVRRELRTPSIALDLLGRGRNPHDLTEITLDAAVAQAVADIRATAAGAIVLVAHSVAGALSPGIVRALVGDVVALVHVAALAPADGEVPLAVASRRYVEQVRAEADVLRTAFRGTSYSPGGGPLPDGLRPMDDQGALLRLDLLNLGCAPVADLEARATPHRTFVRPLRDRVYSAAGLERLARAIGAHDVVHIDASHDVPRSAPRELARLIDDRTAARS